MEQKLGRELDPETETVDHIDRDKTNNNIENLCIKPRPLHAAEDALRVRRVKIKCVRCGKTAYRNGRYIDHNAKQGKAGPFCSRYCSGKYGAEVQKDEQSRLCPQPQCQINNRKYYQKDKHK